MVALVHYVLRIANCSIKEGNIIQTKTTVASLLASGAMGAVLAVASGTSPAAAQPAPAVPPNCTGGDYAGVAAGVSAAMSAYLFTHPDFNAFITDQQARNDSDEATRALAEYLISHPLTAAETSAIRRPLADFDERCGFGAPNSSPLP